MDVKIESAAAGQAAEVRSIASSPKGNENTVVQITEPASERGQILLMKGRDPGYSCPASRNRCGWAGATAHRAGRQRRPRAIELQRRLHAEDPAHRHHRWGTIPCPGTDCRRPRRYLPQSHLLGETVQQLAAPRRILLTVQPPAQDRPLRELPADAGQTAADSVSHGGRLRKGEESVLEYSGMRLRDLPDRVFTKDYLQRLE